MKFSKRIRFSYWFLRDLAKRYRRALFFGFIGGLIVTLVVGRLAPVIVSPFTRRVERIAIVGEYTPSKIPLSIQKEISVGLTTLASDGSPGPGIASSWIAENGGKQYTFTLNEKYWHNNKPLTASDINYNINGVTLTEVNDRTVRAILPDAYSPFPSLVSKPILEVGLRGVGPYRVEELQLKGNSIEILRLVLVNSPSRTMKEYRFYRTEALAVLAYKRGDVDRIEDVSSQDLLSNWNQTTIRATVRYDRVVALYFNVHDPLLQDRNVRQTLAYATPEFNEEIAFSPIPKTSWAYNDKVRQFVYDESQVKKLLANISLPEDFPGFTITTFPQYVNEANKIADAWKKLGIPVKVKGESSVGKDFQILFSAQDIPPDPDQYPFWHSKSDNNITGYMNLKVDKFLEDGRKEIDQEKRKKIYMDFQRVLVEDVPVVFLYHPKSYTIIRSSSLSQ